MTENWVSQVVSKLKDFGTVWHKKLSIKSWYNPKKSL